MGVFGGFLCILKCVSDFLYNFQSFKSNDYKLYLFRVEIFELFDFSLDN